MRRFFKRLEGLSVIRWVTKLQFCRESGKMKNIEISNPDKVLYPRDKITKIDVIKYYIDIADRIMPHIKNRILTVIRCHENIDQNCFFKKHPTNDKDMVKIKKLKNEEYFYLTSIEQLIYQVQMGTLEFHIGGSQVQSFNYPDVMVFDLDPDGKLPLTQLRLGVHKLKSILDELNLRAYLKTSGGKGYHIMVPFPQKKTWQSFSNFASCFSITREACLVFFSVMEDLIFSESLNLNFCPLSDL